MNTFWLVVAENQTDGLTALTRYPGFEAAHAAAVRKARQFPDTTFFLCEAQSAVLCPPSEVVTYKLQGAIREIA